MQEISLTELWNQLMVSGAVYKHNLIRYISALYYSQIIKTGDEQPQLQGYIALLKDDDIKLGLTDYLFIIARVDKMQRRSTGTLMYC